MRVWQYRTVLFELTKDGLLGERYLDDEAMEKSLNELGLQGWELVNVTLLQDGVLAFLKRSQPDEGARPGTEASGPAVRPGIEHRPRPEPAAPQATESPLRSPFVPPVIRDRRPPVPAARTEPTRAPAPERRPLVQERPAPVEQRDDTDFIGGIRIS
ncbi:MAG: DUF4177 domain-containing protein [Desulfobulbus sp.]|jgi:hypothetical protein